ncbi:MAG: MBL fold metallo-hydrolase, partial [Gammaproteobacteria bacterium]
LYLLLVAFTGTASAASGNSITILYDAFGKDAHMTKDWGFSALIRFNGKRILFDTCNNAEIFAHNVEVAGVDLNRLDFVVLSHRHLDHTAGVNYLMQVNPDVRIYAPVESFGIFGSELPSSFYRKNSELPDYLRYYDGHPPEIMTFGKACLKVILSILIPLDKSCRAFTSSLWCLTHRAPRNCVKSHW